MRRNGKQHLSLHVANPSPVWSEGDVRSFPESAVLPEERMKEIVRQANGISTLNWSGLHEMVRGGAAPVETKAAGKAAEQSKIPARGQEDEVVYLEDAVKVVGFPLQRTYILTKQGKIPAKKQGGKWTYDEEKLRQWMKSDAAKKLLEEQPKKKAGAKTPKKAKKSSSVRPPLGDPKPGGYVKGNLTRAKNRKAGKVTNLTELAGMFPDNK